MQKSKRAIPEGFNTVTTTLIFNGKCKEAIEYYKTAFGAVVADGVTEVPDGRVMYSIVQIGDCNNMMFDNFEPKEVVVGDAAQLLLYVDDCDTVFNRAVEAGGRVIMEVADQFWGDRVGQIEDPFGFRWSVSTLKWELTAEEMEQRQREWLDSL